MSNSEDLFKCTVCLSVPRTVPIYQCCHGHLICKECSGKLVKNCPECGDRLSKKKIRNITAEQVIEQSDFIHRCVYAGHGCKISESRKILEKHEKSCPSRTVPCPDVDCPESVSLNKLPQHVHCSSEARENETGIFKIDWSGEVNRLTELEVVTWNAQVCVYEDTTFFALLHKTNGVYYAWLYINGGEDAALKYKVDIKIDGSNTVITHTGKVFPIDVKKEDVLKCSKDVLIFGQDLFMKMAEIDACDDKLLPVKYTISKV
jgi:hypothetical protein